MSKERELSAFERLAQTYTGDEISARHLAHRTERMFLRRCLPDHETDRDRPDLTDEERGIVTGHNNATDIMFFQAREFFTGDGDPNHEITFEHHKPTLYESMGITYDRNQDLALAVVLEVDEWLNEPYNKPPSHLFEGVVRRIEPALEEEYLLAGFYLKAILDEHTKPRASHRRV